RQTREKRKSHRLRRYISSVRPRVSGTQGHSMWPLDSRLRGNERSLASGIAYLNWRDRASSPLPPQPAARGGAGLDLVGHGHGAVERAIERRQHTPLDEIEGGRLAVARARQIADDFLVHPARMRAPHPYALRQPHP